MGNKTFIILTVIVVILAAGGYFYWNKVVKNSGLTPEEMALQNANDAASAITESATQGVLPSIVPETNPLGDVPDINPANKSNPFQGIKTNPFE